MSDSIDISIQILIIKKKVMFIGVSETLVKEVKTKKF